MAARRHLPALDGLRGVAILLVLAAHLYAPLSYRLTRLAHVGWVGVDLFFVLSGFLITGILLEAKGSADYFRAFYARRARRIFPVYYLALIVGLFLLPTSPATELLHRRQVWFWTYTTNVAMGIYGEDGLPARWALFWSLAVEEQFYLLWPAVVWGCSAATLRRLCFGLVLAAWLLRPLVLALGFSTDFAYTQVFTRMDGLCLGALVALVWRARGDLDGFVRPAWIAVCASLPLLVALYIWRTQLWPRDPYVLVLGMPLVTLVCGGVLVLALARRLPWLEQPVLRWLAPYSYGLYVWHRIVTGVVRPELWFARTHVGTALAFGAGVALSLAAAIASWHLFERWFLRERQRRHENAVWFPFTRRLWRQP